MPKPKAKPMEWPYVMRQFKTIPPMGKKSQPGADILLFDSHGEYPIPQRADKPHDGPGIYWVHKVFDNYQLTDAIRDCLGLESSDPDDSAAHIVADFAKKHFPQFELLADFGTLLHLNGSLEDHRYTFTKWVTNDLENGCTGSDDDFFDYWPGAMDMAYPYALALDELSESKHYTTILRRSYIAAVKRRPDICDQGDPSWHYPDPALMKKLWEKYDK